MNSPETENPNLTFLEDRWDPAIAASLDEPELLRYRSNLLGSDLRITNFAGGNTSSKLTMADPLTGQPVQVLWVKGSGGDLGSIKRQGFATLYQQKLLAIENSYKGVELEDEVVDLFPHCAFGGNPVPASIDTPLHGFLPFPHVDHLHPDWAIAMAAAANGEAKMREFNREFARSLVWLPWQRPGFELGLMLRRAVEQNPGCDGILLGGHGLFTWGQTQRQCYLSTIATIDQMGRFIERHRQAKGNVVFGGEVVAPCPNRGDLAAEIAPFLRGQMSTKQRYIAHFSDSTDVLGFVNSAHGRELAFLGTSCPDHFIRTKIRPLFVPWNPGEGIEALRRKIVDGLAEYRRQYNDYYQTFATKDSPAIRDAVPAVVLIPGLGMFSFGKSKTEARITSEFYTNAIHVMEGATLLAGDDVSGPVPQCPAGMDPASFKVFTNYVALPALEAFRIEYWLLEDLKLRRQPAEKELSRRVVVIFGAASPIGRHTARMAAERGAHIVLCDADPKACSRVREELAAVAPLEFTAAVPADLESVATALRTAVAGFGGVDIVIADLPANRLLAAETRAIFLDQNLDGSIVLAASATSAKMEPGKKSFDRDDAAMRAQIRELAASLAPGTRVNAVASVSGDEQTESLAASCAEAVLFLAGPRSRNTTGCVIPVDRAVGLD
jgi:rhamnose utilization protein RhaD (predicted bifunctional aldolase and dehydrogenase)/NAD(P)-dependent dehydrogenase (short-subunit alcohol dehydrogenase family)